MAFDSVTKYILDSIILYTFNCNKNDPLVDVFMLIPVPFHSLFLSDHLPTMPLCGSIICLDSRSVTATELVKLTNEIKLFQSEKHNLYIPFFFFLLQDFLYLVCRGKNYCFRNVCIRR